MPNGKRNYILVIYDSDEDETSIDKLYCTPKEAEAYMAHVMYEYIQSQYNYSEDVDCVESAYLSSSPLTDSPVEINGYIQFYDYNITLRLYRSKKIDKTEFVLGDPNDVEKALIEDGDLFPNETEKYNWETGMRK